MKRSFTMIAVFAAFLCLFNSCAQYKYESVKGDPMKARIYTLDNGLKVYMTVNKESPRIQTYIAVKVGSKCDPAETTGLAHYFEHLMFKGTEQFGTSDYEAEKPLLDQIEQQFEVYRQLQDDSERAAAYHIIDSLSYEASKIAIPNEYDKLMAAIGSRGTNAYTSVDQTVYIEDIPSNQIENWAKIQADRFENNVIRLFHTELETVYEEKNMDLTRDNSKIFDALLSQLYPNHPYGKQTVLGTQEHLKNPSITNIKQYHDKWYVPNNIAICLSGDFDPDMMIRTIDKYFGQWKPNEELKRIEFEPETPIAEPVVMDVYGLESPNIMLGWRLPAAFNEDAAAINMMGDVFYNGNAGMVDLDLNQQQKLLMCAAFVENFEDYSLFIVNAYPKEGQSLDEARDIVIEEIEKLRNGEFDESVLTAIVNNRKLDYMKALENNSRRADMFVNAFINDIPWDKAVSEMDDLAKVTAEDVKACANKYIGTDNYVYIRKQQGVDPNVVKIEKPVISPVVTNRDLSSDFLLEVQAAEVKPIEPVFVDFDKDMSRGETAAGIPILAVKNVQNGIFNLNYLFNFGQNEDRTLPMALGLLDYAGTSSKSAEEIKKELYSIACSFGVKVNYDEIIVVVSGLADNMDKAVEIVEELFADPVIEEATFEQYKQDYLKSRYISKTNQRANFSALSTYGTYGAHNPYNNVMQNQHILSVTADELTSVIKGLFSNEHRILYYGPLAEGEIASRMGELHKTPSELKAVEKNDSIKQKITEENSVIIAPYDAKQIYMTGISIYDEKFNPKEIAINALYNEYFGGGMNSIVFQEMREARGLCYSASARYMAPSKLSDNYVFSDMIATQNDKMEEAMKAFDEIINNMPVSEAAFKLAKDGLTARLRTQRTPASAIISKYLAAERLGINNDTNRDLYEAISSITLEDVVKYQQEKVAGRKYTICILGDEKDLDLEALKPYGKIQRVSTTEIFGY